MLKVKILTGLEQGLCRGVFVPKYVILPVQFVPIQKVLTL